MSEASDRKQMGDTLAAYSLVSTRVAARFLDCTEPHVRKLHREGVLRGVPVGNMTKFDPLTLAVHVLAGEAGVTSAEYWRRHGEATPEHAWRYVARIRKLCALMEDAA